MPDGAPVDSSERIRQLHHAATDIMATETVEEVYRTTIETAETVLGFDFCSVFEREGDAFVTAASTHLTAGETAPAGGDGGVLATTYRESRPVLVEDIAESEVAQPAAERYRSGISVPIGDEAVLQAISATRGYYTGTDLELAELLVVHTEAALEEVRSQRVIADQKRKITQLHRVATELESCHTTDDLFELVLETSKEILGYDWCTLVVWEDDGFVVRMASERSPVGVGEDPFPDGGSQARKILETGESILSEDAQARDDTNPVSEEIRAAVQVPVGDIGVYSVLHHEPGYFDGTDVELAELLAGSVAEAYERITVENRLRERTQELDLFKQISARLFRHNIRNELTPIRGYAEIIEQRGEGEVQTCAESIFESATALLDQTEKARELEAVVETETTEAQHLADVVERSVAACTERNGDPRVEVTVPPATVRAHPKIGLAVQELVENAIEHNDGDRPTVEVYTEDADDGVRLVVEDDGPGMPQSEFDVLQAEEETDLKHGSGVGLWLVRWVVERSDGTLSSELTGSGTRVAITLPEARPEPAEHPASGRA